MELTPYRPFGGLSSFRKELDGLWDRFFKESSYAENFTTAFVPSVDISETKDAFTFKVELPGMTDKDVQVSLSGDLLVIKGEKKTENEEKDEHYHCIERCSGSFQRSFRVPGAVKADKVEAAFDKGVLTITLPKTDEAKKKEVKIQIK